MPIGIAIAWIVAKLTTFAGLFSTATTTVASGIGLAASLVDPLRWVRAMWRGVRTSAGGALTVVVVTLVALGAYTWLVMHWQYGFDTAALEQALARKNRALGEVNTTESAKVAEAAATRAAQADAVRIEYVDRPVPGPEIVKQVIVERTVDVPYAVPGTCPATEAHRLADTPDDLRARLNAIK